MFLLPITTVFGLELIPITILTNVGNGSLPRQRVVLIHELLHIFVFTHINLLLLLASMLQLFGIPVHKSLCIHRHIL